MKRLKSKSFYVLFIFFIIIVFFSAIYVYSIVTGNILEDAAVNNIREVAVHDRNTITMFIEYNWKNQQRIGERLKRNCQELKTVSQINEYLGLEAYESTFDKVYLLMEDGSYYTDITYRKGSEDPDYYPYMDLFADTDSYKVITYDSLPVMGSDKVVIYGYRLPDNPKDEVLSGIKIGEDQKEVYAVIGVCRRSSIVDGLVIENYADESGNTQGYSSVVDEKGEYVVDRKDAASSVSDNLFDIVKRCDRSSLTPAEVQEKMLADEEFWFSMEKNGVRELNYCAPLNSSSVDWYFIMSVNDKVVKDQTKLFVLLIIAAMSAAIIVIIVAFILTLIMQRKTQIAHAQEKAQSEFLSNMSHEIRTPLNGIVGLNYLMMNAIDTPEKHLQIKEWLKKSQNTAEYLLALINDVLDISKLQAGKVEITRAPMLVEAVSEAVCSMQYDNIAERGITFIKDIHITVPCIRCDEVHIKQVLMNIAGNAAKFTPAGGTITFSVNQSMIDENHVMTTFVCEDTGCGMSKEFLNEIFNQFTQDRSSSSNSTKGTGLGMAISKLLVNAMGGEISVESELNKGSRFTVEIPAEICEIPDYLKINANEAEKPDDHSGNGAEATKILVAEDNELNAEILLEILSQSGFVPVHAPNGQEAVEIFEKSKINEFKIILMDMRMPVLDGCEAAARIRALDREDAKTVTIFACTANSFQEDRVKALGSGMDDFLTKPIDINTLLRKMEEIDREKRNSQ